jgi:N-acetyl-gamma-glutamyl-phosphate reductase
VTDMRHTMFPHGGMVPAVAIVGGAGYVAGELIRLLLGHPHALLRSVHSGSHAGRPLHTAHRDLEGTTDLVFAGDDETPDADVLFLCLGHGSSRAWLATHPPAPGTLVIDLAQDHRVASDGGFVYGLPELQRTDIAASRARGIHIANPGCFATALELALLPLAAAGQLRDAVHAHAITGSTGAGQAHTAETHFSWRHANAQVYKPFTHQHLAEVRAALGIAAQHAAAQNASPQHVEAQHGFNAPLHFIPVRGGFTRGILASVYTPTQFAHDEAVELYRAWYEPHPFTHVVSQQPDLKMVVGTNRAAVHVLVHEGMLLATVAIDNLLKGAAGQAVQNMNLSCGLDESAGLQLRAIAY